MALLGIELKTVGSTVEIEHVKIDKVIVKDKIHLGIGSTIYTSVLDNNTEYRQKYLTVPFGQKHVFSGVSQLTFSLEKTRVKHR